MRIFLAGMDQVCAENTLAAMIDLGPGGDYLQSPGTLENCRSLYMPEISDWDPFEDWEKAGKPDLLSRASQKCNQILKEKQEMLIPADIDQAITRFLSVDGN